MASVPVTVVHNHALLVVECHLPFYGPVAGSVDVHLKPLGMARGRHIRHELGVIDIEFAGAGHSIREVVDVDDEE